MDVIDVEGELLQVRLTADEVTRLFSILGDDPIADHLELEMKCQGLWYGSLTLVA
jgi:hypothetical protein